MSTSPASSLPMQPKVRWRKVARRVMLVGVSVLLILAVVFFLIPVWISNDQGRLYVLDRINARLRGPRVTIEKWSLSWFGASDIRNLAILQPDGTPLLTCPHVSSGITLWDCLWSNYDLRNTTADDLDIRVVKNSEGSTSLDSLAAGAAEMIRSARGALQINNGKMLLVSMKSGQSIGYADLKAAITIASPDAPFHVQLTAMSENGAPLALNATCPPVHSLSRASLTHPGIWALLGDVDFSAGHVPAAMTCDFLGLDAAWVGSVGESVDTLQFSNHAVPPDNSRLTVRVRGIPKAGEPTALDAVLQVRQPDKLGRGVVLSVPGVGGGYSISGALHLSPPLARVLGRLNPILGETSSPAAPASGGLIRGEGSFSLPLDRVAESSGAFRLSFPALVFTPRDGPSLVRQFQVLTGDLPKAGQGNPVLGSAGAMRVTLGDGQFSYENFLVTLGANRVNFSGNVSLAGGADLLATVTMPAWMGAGLSAGNTHLVVSGTAEAPLLKRAE